jgi:hypothetical protein
VDCPLARGSAPVCWLDWTLMLMRLLYSCVWLGCESGA